MSSPRSFAYCWRRRSCGHAVFAVPSIESRTGPCRTRPLTSAAGKGKCITTCVLCRPGPTRARTDANPRCSRPRPSAAGPRRPSGRLGGRGVEVFAGQPGELVWLVLLSEVTSCGQQRYSIQRCPSSRSQSAHGGPLAHRTDATQAGHRRGGSAAGNVPFGEDAAFGVACVCFWLRAVPVASRGPNGGGEQ